MLEGIQSLDGSLGACQSLRLASHKFHHSSITNPSFHVVDNIQPWNQGNDLISAERNACPVRRRGFTVPLHSHLANEEPTWVQRRNDFWKQTSVEVIEEHDQVIAGAPKVVRRRISDEEIESKIEPTSLITQLSDGDFRDIDETHLPLSGRQPEGMPTQPSRQVQACSGTGEPRSHAPLIRREKKGIGSRE